MAIFNYQLLGLIAAVLIIIALLPQCVYLLKQSNQALFIKPSLTLLVFGSALWIIYGVRDSSPAIVLLSVFGFTMMSILLVLKLRNKNPS